MPAGVTITGDKSLVAKLDGMSRNKAKTVTYDIGFAAPYAIYVHENLEAKHPNGEAKFLEKAYKRKGPQARTIIKRFVKTKHGLEHGLKKGAELILENAQYHCPVATGRLKQSGYVLKSEETKG